MISYNLVLGIHIFLAVLLIVLVLMQSGKGAEAGAAFAGGSSGSVFGAAGSGNFLTKLTAIIACCIAITSLSLSVLASKDNKSTIEQHFAKQKLEQE